MRLAVHVFGNPLAASSAAILGPSFDSCNISTRLAKYEVSGFLAYSGGFSKWEARPPDVPAISDVETALLALRSRPGFFVCGP